MAETKPTLNEHDAGWWLREIGRSRDHWKRYREEARQVLERYRDERKNDLEKARVSFNILYSNTETLKPAIYAQCPKPDVRRRFMTKDPVGKAGSEVLQRCLSYSLDCCDFDGVMENVRDDYVLPGFAQARIRYKPYLQGAKGKETLAYEEVCGEYVAWDAFTMSRSKVWDKVWWVAFAEDLTKEEGKAAFGDKADLLAYTYRSETDKDKAEGEDNKARVWEVWDKRTRTRLYVSEGVDEFLRKDADPLKLEQFFPCPKPLWMLSTTGSLVPIPEYLMYRDLAEELDDITERIHILVSALRRRGVYNAQHKEVLQKIANTIGDNVFEPLEDWVTLQNNGGLAKAIEEMDLKVLAETVLTLYDYRDRCLNIIYQVTGIADIIRGSSNANETATAQAIKGKYAGMRIGAKQKAFSKFSRDLLRLMGEVIAERFSPQMLAMQSGVNLPQMAQKQQWMAQQQAAAQQWQQQAALAKQQGAQPPPQPQPNPEEAKFFAQPTWEEVIKVLRNDKLRGFKIDIETNSTVLQDEEAEREQRANAIQAVTAFLQQAIPAVQAGAMTMEAAKEMIAWCMRAFPSSQGVEEALDEPGAQQANAMFAQQSQELQKRAEDLAKREAGAKDAEHRAQLAGKDADAKKKDALHEAALLKLQKDFAEREKAMHAEHQSQMEGLAGEAERAAIGAIDKATSGVPA